MRLSASLPLGALLGALVLGLCLGTPASVRADDAKAKAEKADEKADRAKIAALSQTYRDWLDEVALLIGKEERRQFLELAKDYQRDGFIHRFWEARNPYPGGSRNAFKDTWEVRLEVARARYGNITEDRAKMLLLHGEAGDVLPIDCGMALWPLEIWHYVEGERLPHNVYMVFVQRGAGGPFRLWRHADGLGDLIARRSSVDPRDLGTEMTGAGTRIYPDSGAAAFAAWARDNCGGSSRNVIAAVEGTDRDNGSMLDHVYAAPPPRDAEWLDSFRGVSTDLPAGAAPLTATVDVKFPARAHGRTVVQGTVLVPVAAATPVELEGHQAYNFLLSGEVLQGSELAESFRYRFDLPAAHLAGGMLPLTFERTLGSGDYVLVLRVEDLHSHRNFRAEQPLAVPPGDALPELGATREAPAVAAALAAARAELREAPAAGVAPGATEASPAAAAAPAAAGGGAAIHLVRPAGDTQTGALRLTAEASGEGIRKVTFFLDGKEMLSRLRLPYTVELNLGPVPVSREVRAAAYGGDGRELASDVLALNAPKQRFAVRLVEPVNGSHHRGQVLARAEVHAPDGSSIDRLEVFVDDRRIATLYQQPFAQLVPLPAGGGPSFVRAVAYLADGAAAEDLAVINSADVVEKLDVRLVELYAAVFDRAGHPVGRLGESDFKVFEGGEPQTVLRFERVRDLPLHLLLAVDTSASMASSLAQMQQAALAFLQRTLTAKDRAALLTFNDSPVLRTPFTNDLETLAGSLAGLNAERGTALFDSLVYGLTYMRGAQHGQSALILFTDGGDHISHLGFDEALEFARRSGIAIYAIGASIPRLDLQERGRLAKLAEETGGRSFFIDSARELDGVYASIEDELRSRYLLAYQPRTAPRQGEFRAVEVRAAGDGLRVKTIRGYYPD